MRNFESMSGENGGRMKGSRLELERPIGDAISRIRFAPGSDNLLISSWDSVLRLYDVSGSKLRFEAPLEEALLDCCFEDEFHALSAGSDGSARRYNLSSGTQSILGKHKDVVTCIEYSKETGQVITASLDRKLIFWDVHTQNGKIGHTKTVDSEIWSMSLSGLCLLVAVGSVVAIYDLRKLEGPLEAKETSLDSPIQCVRSFSNSQGYVVGSMDGRVAMKFFDPMKAFEYECVFRCRPKSKDRYHLVAVNDIGFHPGYDTFVTGDNEGYAIIWDAQSRRRLFELQRYPGSVASLSYNRNGQLLAVASSYTYQEANEVEEAPQIFLHEMDLKRPNSSE